MTPAEPDLTGIAAHAAVGLLDEASMRELLRHIADHEPKVIKRAVQRLAGGIPDEQETGVRDLSHIRKSPDHCWAQTTRDGELVPCDKPAVAVRLDYSESETGDPYPVCKYHAAGEMVPLRVLLGVEVTP